MKKYLSIALVSLLFLSSCAMNPKPVTGTANQFDSDTYLFLLTTDSVIESTKADLAKGTFPVNSTAAVKAALNKLILAYDAADRVYLAYHTAALNGTATSDQQAAVSAALPDVNANLTILATVKKGSKP